MKEWMAARRELQKIPGVGPSIARDLWELGYRAPEGLRGADPEAIYEKINALRGVRQDRCLLYVFRCAVYFASTPDPRPELLRWWAWKDPPADRPASRRVSMRQSSRVE